MSKFWANKVLMSLVVLLVAVLLLVWRSCEQSAQLSAYKQQVNKFNLGDQVFIERTNKQGEKIIEQEQIILSQKDAIAHNLLTIEELKKVQSQVIIETITKVDSVYIPFDNSWQDENFWDDDDLVYVNDSTFYVMMDDSSLVHLDTLRKQYNNSPEVIYVPKSFSLFEDYYSITGNVLKSGVFIDSLRFKNELTLSIGMKSNGIFKKPLPVVIAKNSNPLIQTSSMQNVVIKNDLKWYDKKITWFAVGVLSGLTTGIILNKN